MMSIRTSLRNSCLLLVGLFSLTSSYSSDSRTKDYLNVPGPLMFDGLPYNLRWSSNPTSNFFIQEYVPKGDNVEHFNKMIVLEAIHDSVGIGDLIANEIKSLTERKKTDLVVNYKLFQNPDSTEFILDFIMSEGKDELSLVEWNAYRYKYVSDSSGKRGVLLFGISIRSYDDIRAFLKSLSQLRSAEITALGKYQVPNVKFPD
jgi:hypothetical protein